MLRVQSQHSWQHNDFHDTNVRRLHGDLAAIKENASIACEKMEALLAEGRYDITLEEARQLLNYELARLGLSDWQGL